MQSFIGNRSSKGKALLSIFLAVLLASMVWCPALANRALAEEGTSTAVAMAGGLVNTEAPDTARVSKQATYSTYAILMSDGKLYRANSDGKKVGMLVKGDPGTSPESGAGSGNDSDGSSGNGTSGSSGDNASDSFGQGGSSGDNAAQDTSLSGSASNGSSNAAQGTSSDTAPEPAFDEEAETARALESIEHLFIDSRVKAVEHAFKVAGTVSDSDANMSQLKNLTTVTFTSSKSGATWVRQAASNWVAKAKTVKKATAKLVKSEAKLLAKARKIARNAKSYAAKGSLGFFQFYADMFNDPGAKSAIRALKHQGYSNRDSYGRTFTSYTKYGAAGDATSMSNMVTALAGVKKCNKLRTSDNHFKGRKNLKITDTLMAMAQSNANWSDKHLDHAGNHGCNYPTGENLAWTWGTDPFTGWYDDEKRAYEGRSSGQTGHYLNIVEASYATTGFAICSRGSLYPVTYSQEFSGSPASSEPSYTVDQYLQRLQVYANFLNNPNLVVAATKPDYKAAREDDADAAAELKRAQESRKEAASAKLAACETIGAGAFEGCSKLKTVNGLDNSNVKTIGARAFKGCTQLKRCAMPQLLGKVGTDAFKGCKNLATSRTPSKSLAQAKVASIADQKRTGKLIQPKPAVKLGKKTLKLGRDYVLSYVENRMVGTAVATAYGIGSYYGSVAITFKIVRAW